LRLLASTLFRSLWGIYLLLTSIYCLLAFLPYTYVALIKEPPYEWMPGFASHHGILYLATLAPLAISRLQKHREGKHLVLLGALVVPGIYLLFWPFMVGLQNNWTAYWWSLAALAPLALVASIEVHSHWPVEENRPTEVGLFTYSNAVLIAVSAAFVYAIGTEMHGYFDKKAWQFGWGRVELTAWSVASHILVAVLVLSALNLGRSVSYRTRWPRALNLALVGTCVFVLLWTVLFHFLDSALTFSGVAAHVYAACLALTLTLFLGSVTLPFLYNDDRNARAVIRHAGRAPFFIAAAVSGAAVALPVFIGGGDWNGVLQGTFTLLFWTVLSVCIYLMRPRRRNYSLVNVVAILFLSSFAYKSLQATEIFWARPLGSTDDEVARAMETYASEDASFQVAHRILDNTHEEPCDDLCRILREYTNIRNAETKTELRLVDSLARTSSERPNIFVFVIDSLRPDYLGAYNPSVDFTPNLDALARDSITVHNVYTQYAGTSLSEPTIWSGAMLLHAHYLQPFAKVNSLEKLARTDGYRMVVSYDEVLSQLLSPSDDLVKLDTDKKVWNQLEVCSTVRQVEPLLDGGLGQTQPVLFYTQPKNVHQFAHNDLPTINSNRWKMRPGFNNRIAYELHQVDSCLGDFFSFLKARGLYENSIIILTSDHGDATGEFGRTSHSLSIFPEIMRVPLIVHLPPDLRRHLVYDDTHLSALTDITPSLYYLLGHRPLRAQPLFGHPLFVETQQELKQYQRNELFLASDERAVYGLLTDNGRLLYTTYDSPAQSFLFDLNHDPNALRSILTPSQKMQYDRQIIEQLHTLADFYGYKPGVGSLLAAAR
jgi:Sulfatase